MQQIAQASGLLVLLVIVTVLARRLSVAELGAYGLVASLAGYLLVLARTKNHVYTFEAWGPKQAFDARLEALVASARSLEL